MGAGSGFTNLPVSERPTRASNLVVTWGGGGGVFVLVMMVGVSMIMGRGLLRLLGCYRGRCADQTAVWDGAQWHFTHIWETIGQKWRFDAFESRCLNFCS